MLNGIPKCISPELLYVLDKMGHGDEIVISDGNFPGELPIAFCFYCIIFASLIICIIGIIINIIKNKKIKKSKKILDKSEKNDIIVKH